jgi:hypothetical protein
VIPRNRLERLPIPLPELAGYLVDSEGQVWREGDARAGRDRPLRGMAFTAAIRTWEQERFHDRPRGPTVLPRMPGVWRWCRDGHPKAVSWHTHGHRDWIGFVHRFVGGLGPRWWRDWSEAERNALSQCAKYGARPVWFVIRTADIGSDSILIAGPVAFASIRSSGTLTTDETGQ